MIAEQPCVADELTGEADRSEPLIVEVVGEPIAGDGGDFVGGADEGRHRPGLERRDGTDSLENDSVRRDESAARAAQARTFGHDRVLRGPPTIVKYWIVTACRSFKPA